MKPPKKFNPSIEMRRFPIRSGEKLDELSSLRSQIKNISTELNHLAQQLNEDVGKRMEKRFQDIKCNPIKLENKSAKQRERQIKAWIGASCKKIFSIGFSLFENDDLDFKKLYSFCSQNVIRHILELSQYNQLQPSEFRLIDNFLKDDLLPYFFLKYPLSEELETNVGFSKKVIEKNNKLNNQNDLFYRSNVKFSWKQDEKYDAKIMEFLNFIINLPETNFSQDTKLYDMFSKDMEKLFSMIEKQDQMLIMKSFDPQNPTQAPKITEKENLSPQQIKEEEKYRQNVRSYTQYKIGRKLSKNILAFSQNQVSSNDIQINSNSLIRIISKWCEELAKCFSPKYIINRRQQFRMKDGSTKFLKKNDLFILSELLAREGKKIQNYLVDLRQNNSQHQSNFAKMPLDDNLIGLSKQEGVVGQFCSKIFKNNESYLIGHLNSLIHGILTATKDFQKIIKVIYKQGRTKIDEFIKQMDKRNREDIEIDIDEFCNKINRVDVSKIGDVSSQIPELMTFLLGDLLRCKISSHENQIIALYNEIERINHFDPNFLNIVRIKNRLESGPKDILLNIMYRNTIVIQLQLAIKTDKSKFLDCSSIFCHYLYELQRAEFGPISQLANIWINFDQRGNFYLSKLQQTNQRILQHKQNKQCCKQKRNQETLKLPFRCTRCQFFYYECNYIKDHLRCKKCKSQICLNCQLEELSYKEARKLLPFLPEMDESFKIEISNQLPNEGLLVNLKSEQERAYFFKKIKKGKRFYIFIEDVNKEFTIYHILKNKNEENNFILTHFILQSPDFRDEIPKISFKEANKNFFIPFYLNKCAKSQKNVLSLVKQEANDQIFESKELKKQMRWPKIKKINLSQNEFDNCENIFQRFENVETAVINFSKIKDIGASISHLRKIKELYLDNNYISSVHENIKECTQLSIVDLKNNQLQQLPQSFYGLRKIQKLLLSNNKLDSIPEYISNMVMMKELNLSHNQLKQLPSGLAMLSSLVFLDISNNKLIKLCEGFGNLGKLDKLLAMNNNIRELPSNFECLQCLVSLNMDNNSLYQLGQNIGGLKKLKYLIMNSNSIEKIGQNFVQLIELQDCQLNNNKISCLPTQLQTMKKLKKISLRSNNLSSIPPSVRQLTQMEELTLDNNMFTQFPVPVTELSKLKKLCLDANQLYEIPEKIGNMKNLKYFSILDNRGKLGQIPSSLKELKQLQTLRLDRPELENGSLPSYILDFKYLQELKIVGSEINKIPKKLHNLQKLTSLELNSECLDAESNQIYSQFQTSLREFKSMNAQII